MKNDNQKSRNIPKRILRNEEVSKILNNLSKYFYLYNFTITVKSKANISGKMIISYKVN